MDDINFPRSTKYRRKEIQSASILIENYAFVHCRKNLKKQKTKKVI